MNTITALLDVHAELKQKDAEIERLTAALVAAREEICWWVSEHGCCAGREDYAMTVIDAALGHQQQAVKDDRIRQEDLTTPCDAPLRR